MFDIQNLKEVALVFVIIGITLAIGVNILVGMKDTIKENDVGSVVNESGTGYLWQNGSVLKLANDDLNSFSAIYNCSLPDYTTIGSANYTVNMKSGIVSMINNGSSTAAIGKFPADTNRVCVNYSFYQKTIEYNASQKTIVAMDEYADWLKILAIAFIASIVIVVIIGLMKKD